MRVSVCAAPCLLIISVLASCAGPHGGGPYAPLSESDRDGDKARKLNAEAAKMMDSKPEKAEKLLRDALTADLYCGPAHNNLGVLYLKQGSLFAAAGEFEWARKLLPGLPEPRMNLALTLEKAGRTEEALATYSTALEVYPDHIATIEAMALLEVKSGKTDERTRKMLGDIAMRGETERWRQWAHEQSIRLTGP